MRENIDFLLKMGSKLCECEIKKDIDTLFQIYKDILQNLSCVDNKKDKNSLNFLMAGIIQKAQKLKDADERCQFILNEMAIHPNVNCRLAVCGCVDDFSKFLQDTDERVVALAQVRKSFLINYAIADEMYKEQISYLTTLLESGLISIMNWPLDSDQLAYQSSLFATEMIDSFTLPYEVNPFAINSSVGIVYNNGMNVDVFRYVTDARVMASYILFLIHSGVIKLRMKREQQERVLERLKPKRFDVLE